MGLSGSTAGSAVANAVKAVTPPAGAPITDAQLTAIWTAVCTAIFAHIQANGIVMPTMMIAPSGGGAVTGTGTIS